MYIDDFGKEKIIVEMPQKGIFHIKVSSNGTFRDSLLTKYGIFSGTDDEKLYEVKSDADTVCISDGGYSLELKDTALVFKGSKRAISFDLKLTGEGFAMDIPITEKERLFGMGDESRECPMKRGHKALMWQKNVNTYGPIPFLVSSEGWGMLVNCTYKHTYDLGAEVSDLIKVEAAKGQLDFYVFLADSMKDIINLYTDISGKPLVLPKSAYGLTFVCNEEEGARDLLQNCLMFRRDDIPCDIMGLEPGWMSEHYDYSTNKKWNPEKFYLPYWREENYNGPWSFFYNLRQMGYKLSLWLCCDYDLLWHEEGNVSEKKESDDWRSVKGAEIMDDHFAGNEVIMDKITIPTEPWFEHLKKFVDQGAAAFKLDGAMQVMEHPDRLWAGKYMDDEVHNVYPVIYVKQMMEGFREYTGRRALIYTPCLYAGTQQYAATWAGDTGGGKNIVPYIMNMAFCGHANASCDLEASDVPSIHFGFLMPWSQILGWRNWYHPWFLGDEREDIIRQYSKLRSSLFPYIYSTAHYAAKTGLAITRPLSLVYEDEPKYDDARNMYMLGDSMLVGVFDMHLDIPEGKWMDWFTGDIYDGGREIDYTVPEGKGGALFIKENSVFVTQAPKPHLDKNMPDDYTINIFKGKDCSFDLIEDDGVTYAYKDGAYGNTHISVSESSDNTIALTVSERIVPGGQDIELPELTGFTVKIHACESLKAVTVNSEIVEFQCDSQSKTAYFTITKEQRGTREVVCTIEF